MPSHVSPDLPPTIGQAGSTQGAGVKLSLEEMRALPLMKTCNRCKEAKPLSEFHKNKGTQFGVLPCCKKCNPIKKHRIKSQYGLHQESLNGLIELLEGKCEVCGEVPPRGLVIDHCHASGKFRGMLCNNCNAGLGMFKDSPMRLATAIEYLNRE